MADPHAKKNRENNRSFPLHGAALYCATAVSLSFFLLLDAFCFGETPFWYASGVISLYLLVRSLATMTRSFARWGKRKLNGNPYTERIVNDYRYRTVLFTYLTFSFNLIYACFKFVVCARTGSIWFGVLGGYYAVLGISRYLALDSRRHALSEPCAVKRRICLYRAQRQSGILMLVMTAALLAAVWQMTAEDRSFSDIPQFIYAIYAVAGYTGYKVTVALINVFRSRSLEDPALSAVREIGYADALVSLFALQASLLLAFGSDGGSGGIRKYFNALTGNLVCCLIFVLGIYMVVHAVRGIRRVRREEKSGA